MNIQDGLSVLRKESKLSLHWHPGLISGFAACYVHGVFRH